MIQPQKSTPPPPCPWVPKAKGTGSGSWGERPCPTHSAASEPGDVPEFGEDPGGGEGRRGQHEPLGAAAALGHQPHVARLGCLGPHQLELPTLGGKA